MSYQPHFTYSPKNDEWKIDYKHYLGREVKIREPKIEDALRRNREERERDNKSDIPF